MKTNLVGDILRRNFLPRHVIDGKIRITKNRGDGKTRKKNVSSWWMILEGNERILEIESRSTRSHYVEIRFESSYGPAVR
jgi:hypothetical protein